MGRDGLLVFFEMPKGVKQKGDRNALGAMQHVSFAVSPESQARIRTRLDATGSLTMVRSKSCRAFLIHVFDPNDIRLEFSCQPGNGEGEPHIVPQVTQTKAQAMEELRSLTADEKWLAWATAALPE